MQNRLAPLFECGVTAIARAYLACAVVGLAAACGSGGGGGSVVDEALPDGVVPIDSSNLVVINDEWSAPNVLLVRFWNGATEEDMREVIAAAGGRIVGFVPLTMLVQARFDGDWTAERANALMEQLQAVPIVKAVYLESVLSINAAPVNDPWPPAGPDQEQCESADWGDDLTKHRYWPIKAMRADRAWEKVYAPGREVHRVHLGVIDTGFSKDHADLPELELTNEQKGDFSHGMHVAGIMAAQGNNCRGIAGITYQHRQVSAFDGITEDPKNKCQGLKGAATVEDGFRKLLGSVDYPRVINLSAGYRYYDPNNPIETFRRPPDECPVAEIPGKGGVAKRAEQALDFFEQLRLADKDVLVVQGAGNTRIDARYSGYAASALWGSKNIWTVGWRGGGGLFSLVFDHWNHEEIASKLLVVGATYPVTSDGVERASYSNDGEIVEVWAPGGEHKQFCPQQNAHGCQIISAAGQSGYAEMIGTSMAAPHVSGLAGLLWQINPAFSAAKIKDFIRLRGEDGRPLAGARSLADNDVALSGVVADAEMSVVEALRFSGHRRPIANLTCTPAAGGIAAVICDGSNSADPDGDSIVKYNWVLFSDKGGPIMEAPGMAAQMVMPVPKIGRNYRITLSVVDATGMRSQTRDVTVFVPASANVPAPVVKAVLPTQMTGSATEEILTIEGVGFRFRDIVQFKRGAGPGAGVWVNSRGTPVALSSTRIRVRLNPGDAEDTILVRVCRPVALANDAHCSNGNLGVKVLPPLPTIRSDEPRDVQVVVGQSATFAVNAEGATAYEWRQGNLVSSVPAPGVNNQASYTIESTRLEDSGKTFFVFARNAAGSVASRLATLTVTAAPVPPSIQLHPQSRTVSVGQSATFTVSAIGTNLNYAWFKGTSSSRVPAPGATNAPTYTTPPSTLADNGSTYFVVVSNAAGSATSDLATLTVYEPPPASPTAISITATPDPVRPGQLVQYAVTVTNRSSVTQHYVITAQVPGHTSVAWANIGIGGHAVTCGGVTNQTCPAGATIQWGNRTGQPVSIAAGQSVTVTFAAVVDTTNPPADGTVIRATATATNFNATPSSATAAVDVVVSTTDLALGMVNSPSPVAPGGVLSYTLRVGNPNGTSSPAAMLTAQLPPGVNFVSASDGGALIGSAVQWNVGALAPGAAGQRQVVVQVDPLVANGSVLIAAANLQDAASGRSLARANAATAVLTSSDTQAAMTATPDPVRPGQLVQYAVTVTNRSSVTQHYVITAQVPGHTSVAWANIGIGGHAVTCGGVTNQTCPAGATIQWGNRTGQPVSIAAGQSVTVTFAAVVDTTNPPADGTVIRATATATNFNATPSSATAAVDVAIGP